MQPSRIASSSLSARSQYRTCCTANNILSNKLHVTLSTSSLNKARHSFNPYKQYKPCKPYQASLLGSKQCSITTTPNATSKTVNSSSKYLTDTRSSLSSLSTASSNSTIDPSPNTTINDINPSVAAFTNLEMNKKAISEKNLEVMQLLQSLQNVVETQRNFGLLHLGSSPSSSNRKEKNVEDIKTDNLTTSVTTSLTPWQEFDHNMDKIFHTSSSLSSLPHNQIKLEQNNDPVAQQLTQQIQESQQWHNELSKAVHQKEKEEAINLFYKEMPPDKFFLHIIYKEDSIISVKSFFHTMHKFINLMTPERLDIAFDVFLSTADLCTLFERHLKGLHKKGKNDNFDENVLHLLKEQNTSLLDDGNNGVASTPALLQEIKECRELLFFRIISSMGLANEKYSRREGNNNTLYYSRATYTDMMYRLFNIIRYDIKDDPMLQHSLLPQLIACTMRQRFCSTMDMKRLTKKIFDVSISLLKSDLQFFSTDFSRNDKKDDSFQVENVNRTIENEGWSEELVNRENENTNHEISVVEAVNEHSDDEYHHHHQRMESDLRKWSRILSKYTSLLHFSSFRRQETLPFVELLDVIVSNGGKPKPDDVLNILQNEYPYHNKFHVKALMQSIIHLQGNKLPNEPDYLITPNSLQYITCATSKKGHVDTITLIWEYLNLLNTNSHEKNNPNSIYLQPTEGLYENAASTYAESKRQDQLVFSILAEMEEAGLKPSRNFLIRLSKALRTHSTIRRVDAGIHMIRNKINSSYNSDEDISIKPTTSALNTLLATLADFGFTSRAMELYNEFEDFGCTPDENTYLFLMKSIEMDVSTCLPPTVGQSEIEKTAGEEIWVESQVMTADAILDAAVQMGHGDDEHLVEAYLKILHSAKEVEKAVGFLGEKLRKKKQISNHSLGLIALANAEQGNKDIVEEIVQLTKQDGKTSHLPKHVMELIGSLLHK